MPFIPDTEVLPERKVTSSFIPDKPTPSFTPDRSSPTSNLKNMLGLLFGPKAAVTQQLALEKVGMPKLSLESAKRYGKGFLGGAVGTVGGMARSMEAFLPEQFVGKNIGKWVADRAKIATEFYQPPDPKFADAVASGFGSMASFIIPGMGVSKGIKAINVAPKIANWLGAAASGVLEAMTEGGSTFDRAKEKGMADRQAIGAATKTFWLNLPTVVFTNKFGIFGDKGGRILKGLKSAPTEAFQEWTQSLISNMSVKDPLLKGSLESALVGGIVGGTTGVLIPGTAPTIPETKGLKITPKPPTMIKPHPSEYTIRKAKEAVRAKWGLPPAQPVAPTPPQAPVGMPVPPAIPPVAPQPVPVQVEIDTIIDEQGEKIKWWEHTTKSKDLDIKGYVPITREELDILENGKFKINADMFNSQDIIRKEPRGSETTGVEGFFVKRGVANLQEDTPSNRKAVEIFNNIMNENRGFAKPTPTEGKQGIVTPQRQLFNEIGKAPEVIAPKPKVTKEQKTWSGWVKKLGGINLEKAEAAGYTYQDFKEFGVLGVLGGKFGVDEIAQEMQSMGILNVPEGENPSKVLMNKLQYEKGKILQQADEFEKGFQEVEKQWLREKKDDEFKTGLKNFGYNESDIEQVIQFTETDAETEAQSEIAEEFGEVTPEQTFIEGTKEQAMPPTKLTSKVSQEGDILKELKGIKPEEQPELGLPKAPSAPEQIRDIIKSSKSMLEAQRQIKEKLGIDLTIPDLKKYETQVKGGMLPDMADKLINDIADSIKKKDPSVKVDYGTEAALGISPEELQEHLSGFGMKIEEAKELIKDLAKNINNIWTIHNWLHSREDSRPLIEGITDSFVKDVKNRTDIVKLRKLASKVKNPVALANLWIEADRNLKVNHKEKLGELLKIGSITQQDYNAGIAVIDMQRFAVDRLMQEILESKLGVRIRSFGKRYLVSYKTKEGEHWITGIQLENLQQKQEVKILDEREYISIKKADPETGEYITRKEFVKSYEEVKNILSKEEQNLIDELLPYREGNYISHIRKGGNFWVEVFERVASGEKDVKIFTIRVPNMAWAKKIEQLAKQKMPSARVEIKPHTVRFNNAVSFGTLADVQVFLKQLGIDTESEIAQRIINAYRSMSPLLSSLIHAQNIAGYRVDWSGIVEGITDRAYAATSREHRLDLKDLQPLIDNIKDEFVRKKANDYLQSHIMPSSTNSTVEKIGNAMRSLVYFMNLANKTTFVIQNLTEPLWAVAIAQNQLKDIKETMKFLAPLPKEYDSLIKKAQQEGIIKSYFLEEIEGVINKLDILGKVSESFSTQEVFKIGLHLARAKNIQGVDNIYRFAYQFLFNDGKPFYHQANKMAFLSDPQKGFYMRKYGMVFLNWLNWWGTKLGLGGLRLALKFGLILFLLAGMKGFPFGRKILASSGLIPVRGNPNNYNMMERFLLGGVLNTFGIDTAFLRPLYTRGLGDIGSPIKSAKILADNVAIIKRDFTKYGISGAMGHIPLAGIERFILGAKKAETGILTKSSNRFKLFYKPQTEREKNLLRLGLTPSELGERYSYKYGGESKLK